MIDWPPTLPQRVLVDSYGRSLGDARITSDTDSGLGKMRARLSRVPELVRVSMEMSTVQREAFEAFVRNDLERGTKWFRFPNVDGTGEPWVVRIGQTMPNWNQRRPNFWLVSFDLTRMPQ